jgi:hypothetical protein
LKHGEWSDAKNITFTPDGIRTYYGFTDLCSGYTFPEAILWVSTVESDVLFFGRRNVYYSLNGANPILTNWTEIENATYWNECETPQWVLFFNGIQKPRYWDAGSHDFTELTNAPIAKIYWYQSRHLLAVSVESSKSKMMWSDLDDLINWTTGEAGYGYFDLPNSDEVMCVSPIGGNYYIISYRGMWQCKYLGYPIYWSINPVLQGIGILSSKSISEFGDESIIMSNDNVYNSDGYNIEPINNGILRQLYLDMHPATTESLFSIFDEYKRHVLFFYVSDMEEVNVWGASTEYAVGDLIKPTQYKDVGYYYECKQAGTSGTTEPTWLLNNVTDGTVIWKFMGAVGACDRTVLYNYYLDRWCNLDLGKIQAAGFWRKTGNVVINDIDILINDWASLIDAKNYLDNFPTLIFVDERGKIHELDYSGVVKKEAYCITGYIPLEEKKVALKRKFITSIQLKGTGSIKVRIGYIKHINSGVIWSDDYNYNFRENEKIEVANDDIEAKYIVLKFENNIGTFFELYSILVDFAYVGTE